MCWTDSRFQVLHDLMADELDAAAEKETQQMHGNFALFGSFLVFFAGGRRLYPHSEIIVAVVLMQAWYSPGSCIFFLSSTPYAVCCAVISGRACLALNYCLQFNVVADSRRQARCCARDD